MISNFEQKDPENIYFDAILSNPKTNDKFIPCKFFSGQMNKPILDNAGEYRMLIQKYY